MATDYTAAPEDSDVKLDQKLSSVRSQISAEGDRIRQEDGSYVDGPAVFYDVAVGGSQATNLVEAAERSGNIRITFSGRYRVTEYKGEQGTRIQHEVRADEVSVSLRGQSVAVERSARADERETDTY